MTDIPRHGPARAVRLRSVGDDELELRYRVVHGYRRAFRMAGEGPALVLIHGIGDSSATWAELIPDLARNHTVIAPDLLGHGASDKPRADYSVAAYANGVRDLLTTLGIESATLVGHSLGGGVAMQFAYQFPERTDGSSWSARAAWAASQPRPAAGLAARRASRAVRAAVARHALQVGLSCACWSCWTPSGPGRPRLPHPRRRAARRDLPQRVHPYAAGGGRLAGPGGDDARPLLSHRGHADDAAVGDRDSVVPVRHAYGAHEAMPGSRLEIFEGAGHFPFHSDPARFVALVRSSPGGARRRRGVGSTGGSCWSTGGPGQVVERDLREVSERSAT